MNSSLYANTKEKAVILLNQFRDKHQRVFTVADFYDCETEVQIENRYKALLTRLFNE